MSHAGSRIHSTCGSRSGWLADLSARIAVVRPRLHLFGRIHQDGGLWELDGTVHANVTAWECGRAPTAIDLDEHTIMPVLIPPLGRTDDL